MTFTPPGPQERLLAIGPVDDLPHSLRRAFDPADDFDPIHEPEPNDWLANHPEQGQTFEQFVQSKPNRPDKQRGKLYLQPIGQFAEGVAPPLDRVEAFAEAFFMMEVEVLPAIDLARAGGKITSRRNPHTENNQLLTGDLLALLRGRLPGDAYAMLGITMTDLYPDPKWNFVFGQASLRERVGVYSFARYDPSFFGKKPAERGGEDVRKLMLLRSCKVLAHETAHMFGIHHCIFFRCLENGANHLDEFDAAPMHLCPADLRKLQHSVGFDFADRYERLRAFYKEEGFEDQAQWLTDRLGLISATQ